MSYRMNCDFFTVQFPNALDQRFPDVLADIMTNRISPQERDFEKNGDTMRLAYWGLIAPQTFYKGLMIRMCNNSTLRKASVSTDTLDYVRLLQDERICEIMCFAYFDETGTLAVHRNRKAGSPYWLEDYVADKSGLQPQLQVIMDSSAWDRLERMGIVKKIDVVLSIPQNVGALDGSSESVASMVELTNSYRGSRLSFEISAGRKREGLKSDIKGLARQVFRIGGNVEVEKLSAKGADDDGTHELDLLAERIKGSEVITPNGEEVSTEEIWTALYKAYYKVRNEIRRQAIL